MEVGGGWGDNGGGWGDNGGGWGDKVEMVEVGVIRSQKVVI